MAQGKSLSEFKNLLRGVLVSGIHEHGIKLYDLNNEYRALIGTNIPYYSFGYRSLEDLMRSMPDVVMFTHYMNCKYVKAVPISKSQHVRDMVLKNKNIRKNPRFKLPVQFFSKSNQKFIAPKIQELAHEPVVNDECKAPLVDKSRKVNDPPNVSNKSSRNSIDEYFHTNVDGVCSSSEELTQNSSNGGAIPHIEVQNLGLNVKNVFLEYQQPTYFQVGNSISFYISEIITPQHFYFHLFHDLHAIINLTDKLNNFYNRLLRSDGQLLPHDMRCGQSACVYYSGSWCRAQILQIHSNEYVKIFLVDYGIFHTVTNDCIKYLAPQFGRVPKQTLFGFFTNLNTSDFKWSKESFKLFAKTLDNKLLRAELKSIDINEGGMIHLELKDTDKLLTGQFENLFKN